MKRKIFSHPIFIILLFSMVLNPFGFAKSPDKNNFIVSDCHSIENYNLYSNWNLGELGLSFNVFDYAIKGFSKLKESGFFEYNHVLTIIDFSKAANEKRLFVVDLDLGKVLFNTYVAHGRESGDLFAKYFSNKASSLKSSLGFFETAATYIGKHGYSLKLNGLEKGINDQANKRAIVFHGASYVSESYIRENGTIGRSWGCPAVPSSLSKPIIDKIKGGSCIFIYAEDSDYINCSKVFGS